MIYRTIVSILEEFCRGKKCIEQPTTSEPIRMVDRSKTQRERKKHKYKNRYQNNPEKKRNRLNQVEDFNLLSNQHYLLEEFVYHLNILTQPIEVSSLEGMSNIIRGETIPMACSCFFSLKRNTQFFQKSSNNFSKQTMLKQLFRSRNTTSRKEAEKEYTDMNKRFEIFWRKLIVKLKSLIKEILFGGGKRGSQQYDWEPWLSEVIVEVFVVGKPDNPKNFCTGGKRSILENIGTIFG
jgi:hypothetical protein